MKVSNVYVLHSMKQIVVLANNLVTAVAWLSSPC